jgi:hypothetical protein
MRRRAVREETGEDQNARFAWWASFLVTLVVVGLLSIVHSAQAAQPLVAGPSGGPLATAFFPEDLEAEEEEWEEEAEEECEWDAEEEELWCGEEREEALEKELEESREEGRADASECIVTDVDARVAAQPRRKRLALTVRYKGERRAAVAIAWRLRGAKGKLGLGTERARFSRAGTYRHFEKGVRGQRMRKALAAREFRVEVRALNTPAHCKRDLATRLGARRTGGAGPYWVERAAERR